MTVRPGPYTNSYFKGFFPEGQELFGNSLLKKSKGLMGRPFRRRAVPEEWPDQGGRPRKEAGKELRLGGGPFDTVESRGCSSPFYFALFLPLILAQHAAFSTRLSAARGLQRTTFSRIDKRKIRNHGFQPCKPECFLPASTANRPLGVAKSHAVKKKKKDGNQAVSAVTAAFPAKNIKRKGPKQQVVASDLCG